jgi:hypothetical protein
MTRVRFADRTSQLRTASAFDRLGERLVMPGWNVSLKRGGHTRARMTKRRLSTRR